MRAVRLGRGGRMAIPWLHFRSMAEPAAASLAALEARSVQFDHAAFRAAALACWSQLIDDAEHDRANASIEYLAGLHRRLAAVSGGIGPGQFTDGPCYYIGQLRWGGHVRSFALSL